MENLKVLAMRFILVMGLILTGVLQIAAQQVFRPEYFLTRILKSKHLLIRCLGCLGFNQKRVIWVPGIYIYIMYFGDYNSNQYRDPVINQEQV